MLQNNALSAIPVISDLIMDVTNNVQMDIGVIVKIISANVIYLIDLNFQLAMKHVLNAMVRYLLSAVDALNFTSQMIQEKQGRLAIFQLALNAKSPNVLMVSILSGIQFLMSTGIIQVNVIIAIKHAGNVLGLFQMIVQRAQQVFS